MKVGLSTDNFRKYIPLIREEVLLYMNKYVFGEKSAAGSASNEGRKDAVDAGGEITVCTAAITLQGKEVREGLDASFADLYHDLE